MLDPTVYCEEPVAFPDMWSGLLVVARQDMDDSQPYDLMLQQCDISTLECFRVLSRKGAAESRLLCSFSWAALNADLDAKVVGWTCTLAIKP